MPNDQPPAPEVRPDEDKPGEEKRAEPKAKAKPAVKRRRSWWHFFGITLVVLIVLLGAARLAMPYALRWYVNRTLDKNPLYDGRIGEITVHLWRGAYTIHDVRLVKTTGDVPVPLYSAKRVDLAIQWDALLHRHVVGRILMDRPELNFVDAPSDADAQTGAGGPWLEIIRELFPFKINRCVVRDGSIHFRAYQVNPPVDVYLAQLDASVDDLTNIGDETTPLVATVKARALAMDQAKFQYEMKLDPFSYNPTFHLTTRLVGLDVTKINDLALAYGKFDFKRGWFDLVVDLDCKEGELNGYVKPLFRNLKVFGPEDLKEDPLRAFWQALVGVVTRVLTNPPRDQFGTLIPFHGSANTPSPDVMATIGNVLRNAFIRAYLPRLEPGVIDNDARAFQGEDQTLRFDPPSLEDPVSAGDDGSSR